MLTPLDIQNKVFKTSFRGYDAAEVDDFLNLVIEGYEKLYKENIDCKDRNTMLTETINQYKTMEETLTNALVVAQSAAEQVQHNASEKADNIISEAENQAKQIIANAHNEVKNITYKYQDLKRSVDVYRAKMIALLNSQLDILKSVKTSDETLFQLVGVNEALETLNEVQKELEENPVAQAAETEQGVDNDGGGLQ